MPIQTTANIWHNGTLIPWEKATDPRHEPRRPLRLQSVFEGIRCYAQPHGIGHLPPARAHAAPARLGQDLPHGACPTRSTSSAPASSTSIEANGVAPCYIRPIALRGYGEIGVNPKGSPIEVYIANFPWGKYVPGDDGADVCISSWNRAGAQHPALARQGRRQLHELPAHPHGSRYQRLRRGIALDVNGLVSEGSGENIFVVRNGVLYTPPLANSALSGITRDSVLTIARHLGITGHRAGHAPRAALHRRRSLLHRHRRRSHAHPLHRSHSGRRRQARPNHQTRSPTSSSASPTASDPTASAGSPPSKSTPNNQSASSSILNIVSLEYKGDLRAAVLSPTHGAGSILGLSASAFVRTHLA